MTQMQWQGNAVVIDGRHTSLADPEVQAALAAGGEILPEDVATAWDRLRAERDARLSASDWAMLPDAPTDQAAWGTYRQALRDLPQKTIDPMAPDWPAPPT